MDGHRGLGYERRAGPNRITGGSPGVPTNIPVLDEKTGELIDVVHYYPDEAAPRLHVSRRTLIARVKSGRWPGIKIGRTTYMTDADIGEAYRVERELTAQRRPGTSPLLDPPARPRLGLAVAPDDADRLEGLR